MTNKKININNNQAQNKNPINNYKPKRKKES